jgi:hypothetical protein
VPGRRRVALTLAALTFAAVYLALSPPGTPAAPPVPAESPDAGEVRWLKGQTHVHPLGPVEGDTVPFAVARRYARLGYDFIIFTEQNRVMSLPPVESMLVLPGIELTFDFKSCVPNVADGGRCVLHVAGLFVDPDASFSLSTFSNVREEVVRGEVERVQAAGGIAGVVHPDPRRGMGLDELLVAADAGARWVEVANAGAGIDGEALWRAALDAGARLFPVAADDAQGPAGLRRPAACGSGAARDQGWIWVRARKEAASIRAAIERGDFYAETRDGRRWALSDLGP